MKYVTLNEIGESVERRKAELGLTGDDYVRPNSGAYRTLEKRALLQAVQRMVEQSGARPRFVANYRAI